MGRILLYCVGVAIGGLLGVMSLHDHRGVASPTMVLLTIVVGFVSALLAALPRTRPAGTAGFEAMAFMWLGFIVTPVVVRVFVRVFTNLHG